MATKSTSDTTKTTRGGVEFDVLCKWGEQNYSFKLTDLAGVTDVKEAVPRVKTHITTILAALQPDKNKTIDKFYIGKTSTRKNEQCKTFDHMKKETMNKQHISKRWNGHKEKGKDGMVVLTVITREIATSMGYEDDTPTKEASQEKHTKGAKQKSKAIPKCAALKCALDIEKKLQEQFTDSPQLEHGEDFREGPAAENAQAYPLYITYKYLEPRNSKNCKASYHFHLVDLSKAATLIQAGATIADKISENCDDLKVGTEGKEPKIEIGHTYLSNKEDCTKLNPMESKSFDKKGIQEKWALHRREGKNGMKVIAVVTNDIAKSLECKDQQECVQKIKTELKKKSGWKILEENGEKDTDMCLYFTYSF